MPAPLLALALLLVPRLGPADAPGAGAARSAGAEPEWHAGGFAAALAQAAREERLLFVDCQAAWCTWCRRLEQESFTDPAVAARLAELVCVSIDVEAPENVAIARRYGVAPLPTMLFLDGEGALVDVLVGYLGPEELLAELERVLRGEGTVPALRRRVREEPERLEPRFALVRKLSTTRQPDAAAQLAELQRLDGEGRGYDPDSVEDRWRLVQAWRTLRDEAAAGRHLEAIRRLDPEGRSLALRSEALARLRTEIDAGYAREGLLDHAPLLAFLAEERHPELRFEGWMLERFLCGHEAEEARKRDAPERRAERLAAQRRAEREAWAVCPPEQRARLGHDLAWSWYEASEELAAEELAFALEVARAAAAAAPASATHQDTLACLLWESGALEEALAAARRARALEPDEPRWAERVSELEEELAR